MKWRQRFAFAVAVGCRENAVAHKDEGDEQGVDADEDEESE
jgi:hypothetical protein